MHEKTNGAINWFWTDGAGAAGAGFESVCGWAAQHGIIAPPAMQQASTCLAQDAGVCAGTSGSPASRKLQTMAQTNFTMSPSHIRTQMAKPILPFTRLLLSSPALSSWCVPDISAAVFNFGFLIFLLLFLWAARAPFK
jgi:hypothetical protein